MKKITLLFTLLFSTVLLNAQCNAPTNVHMENEYESYIIWNANNADYWDIEYGLTGFEPSGIPVIENYNHYYYSPQNIVVSEYIDFYVRANCDEETSEWVGPFSFFNYCTDWMGNGYGEEDFENDNISNCWTQTNEGTPETGIGLYGESAWELGEFANSSTSTAAKVHINGTDVNEWLILPLMRGMYGVKYMWGDNYVSNYTIALTQADSTEEATLGEDDVVQMLISTDLGVTWTPIRAWDATTPISNTGESINIEYFAYGDDYDLFEQAFLIAFWASSGVENDANVDFFIDNLTAEPPFSGDVPDLAAKGFGFYPNPSKTSINLSAKETINHIEIYNHLGQKVKQTTLNALDAQLDITTLPKGIYFMKVQIGETSGIVSLIKD